MASFLPVKRLVPLAVVPLLSASTKIYVANSDDDKVTVIDPATDKVVGQICRVTRIHTALCHRPTVPGSMCRARARMCST